MSSVEPREEGEYPQPIFDRRATPPQRQRCATLRAGPWRERQALLLGSAELTVEAGSAELTAEALS